MDITSTRMSKSRTPYRRSAVLGVIAVVLALGAPVDAGRSAAPAMPRDKTLYTSGTATAPPTDFNPLDPDRAYTGTQGLLYEPLFLFDPVRDKFIPWLATGGSWVSATTYRIDVRPGVDWVQDRSGSVAGVLSSSDVAYSINLAATDDADPFHADAASVQKATANGGTVTVEFKAPVGYAPWQEFLWHDPVVPQAGWSHLAPGAALGTTNMSPVSTGPMLLATTAPTGACYRDNPHWWGTAQLRLSFKFEYLCAVVSGPSGTELSELLNGRTDWSNELLAGHPRPGHGPDGRVRHQDLLPGLALHVPRRHGMVGNGHGPGTDERCSFSPGGRLRPGPEDHCLGRLYGRRDRGRPDGPAARPKGVRGQQGGGTVRVFPFGLDGREVPEGVRLPGPAPYPRGAQRLDGPGQRGHHDHPTAGQGRSARLGGGETARAAGH